MTGTAARGLGPVVVLGEATRDGSASPALLEAIEEAATVAATLRSRGPFPGPDDEDGGDWDGGGPEPQPAVEVWLGGWSVSRGGAETETAASAEGALARVVGAHGGGGLRWFPPAADPEAGFDPEVAAASWAAGLAAVGAPLALASDTAPMRECLPRIALRLRAPTITAAVEVRVRGGAVEVLRDRDAGLRMERCRFPMPGPSDAFPSAAEDTADDRSTCAPVLVAMTGGIRGTLAPDPSRPPATLAFDPPAGAVGPLSPPSDRVRIVDRRAPKADSVAIAEAERIVAGGAGIGSSDKVGAYLERLARPLGAAVGGTRVISDRGWIPHGRYIGSTGKTVSPALYLALGISGASQHVVGIKDAGTIVAINQDRTAPMVGLADLALIGDVHAVAPALAARLEARARAGEDDGPPGTANDPSDPPSSSSSGSSPKEALVS